jgi:hypothetical protein
VVPLELCLSLGGLPELEDGGQTGVNLALVDRPPDLGTPAA